MDEMTALTRFRARLAYADPAVLARTRNRLLDLADGRRTPDHGRGRFQPARRRLAVAAVVTALATTGVIAADSLVVDDRPVGATAEAADMLQRAADATIAAADPPVGPDEYLRVTTVAVYGSAYVDAESGGDAYRWLSTYTQDLFIPGDPGAEWVLRRSSRVPYRPEDVQAARRAGVADTPGFTERAVGGAFFGTEPEGDWQSPTREFLASLPTEPQELLERIYRDSAGKGPSRDGEAMVYIADLLRSGIVPADLRAALFRAAALIPGVELVEQRANLDGRTGVAVGRYEPATGTRTEIIFDPETGELIGEREVLVDHSAGPTLPAGSAIAWTAVSVAVVPAAEVDAIPAQPPPGRGGD